MTMGVSLSGIFLSILFEPIAPTNIPPYIWNYLEYYGEAAAPCPIRTMNKVLPYIMQLHYPRNRVPDVSTA